MENEIRKEFQLERMVLFTDAVFAIVITLMAIEIRVPEVERGSPSAILTHELLKLIPMFMSYAVSFFFIGHIWYHHLKLFSLLKDYDKGLVIRNLIMLFFTGLFPFSVALMVKSSYNNYITWVIYFGVIISTKTAQLVLTHYILYRRPHLRLNASVKDDIINFKRSRFAVSMLVIAFTLVMIVYTTVENENVQPYVWFVFLPFPVILKYYQKRIKA